MKVFRYIFIVIVIGLIIFAVYNIYNQNNKEEEQEQVETAVVEKEPIKNIRLGISKYDTMNPILSTNKAIQYIDKLIFEPLLNINEDFSINNCLAKEYSKTGDLSYLIKLRDDVKWHDGMPFEAKDVQFTIDILKDTENPIYSIYQESVKNIQRVDVIDNYTIKITLDTQIPFFEYNLIFPILPYHYYIDENFAQSSKIPIGTGMYKIVGIQPQYISINKNEDWWNKGEKQSKIEDITINLYTSMGEVYNAFKIGNIDILQTANENYSQYIGTIGYSVKDFIYREYDFLAINTTNATLAKKEVRQAIAQAIDKNNIVATIYNNTYGTSEYPLDYGNYLYDTSVGNREYSPEQAQKILEDNGWTLNYMNWTKYENYRTYRTSFNLVVNSSNVKRVAVAESIKNQLEAIGIGITIRAVSDDQYSYYLEHKNYDLIITGTNISASPNLEIYFGQNNYANYTNDRVNNMMKAVYSMNDKKLLKDTYKQIQEIYKEDVPYVSLYRNKEYLIYNPTLIGDLNPNWYNLYYNFENWYRQN